MPRLLILGVANGFVDACVFEGLLESCIVISDCLTDVALLSLAQALLFVHFEKKSLMPGDGSRLATRPAFPPQAVLYSFQPWTKRHQASRQGDYKQA